MTVGILPIIASTTAGAVSRIQTHVKYLTDEQIQDVLRTLKQEQLRRWTVKANAKSAESTDGTTTEHDA